MAYQGTPADPLVDVTQCQLDAASMQTIGTNSIRVYHVDPWENHDGCMSAFENAGIYVWLDLDTFNTTIVQTAPEWSATQFLAFAQVMDVFQQYDNLGGFWIGNEVINMPDGAPSAPYVKAATANLKSYMAAKNYRTIPIGYSAADIAELRPMLQNYLACGDPSQSIDFFGLNSYEWCGDATYQTSGYSNLQAMSQGYSIPIFFSETGCNVGGPRTFSDQDAIFGPDMIDTWSGSIIYEWVQETNNYGLVNYPNGQIYSGAPIPISPDFPNLQSKWASINPSGIAEAAYTPSFSPPPCPAATAGWNVNGAVPIPTLGSDVIQSAVQNKLVPSQAAPQTSASKIVLATNTGIAPSTSEISSTTSLPPVIPPTSSLPGPSSMVTSSPSQLVASSSFSAGAVQSSGSSASAITGAASGSIISFH